MVSSNLVEQTNRDEIKSHEIVYDNILELIGDTPLVKLNRITKGLKARVYAKLEMFNPGGSVKDRIGLAMIDAAEKAGVLNPGDVLIEPTSGNTGIGLALVAVLRNYPLICTIPVKMSVDKINILRAYGAFVVITPTAVSPEDPRYYVNVAKIIAKEISKLGRKPNRKNLRRIVRDIQKLVDKDDVSSLQKILDTDIQYRHVFIPNQYFNPANPEAHYRTTGPEIWRQTKGKIDILVAGMGTGGTITGTARFLKEKNPKIRIVGVDPEGSLYHHEFYREKGEVYPYQVEGIGEDFIPSTLDMNLIDEIVVVSDKDAFLMARKLARVEGILAGGSSGAAVYAALKIAKDIDEEKNIVVILPDTGRNYLNKIFNDEWLLKNGYISSIDEVDELG